MVRFDSFTTPLIKGFYSSIRPIYYSNSDETQGTVCGLNKSDRQTKRKKKERRKTRDHRASGMEIAKTEKEADRD